MRKQFFIEIEILVETKTPYKITVGQNLIDEVGDKIRTLGINKIALVTDENVWSIYKNKMMNSLNKAGILYEVLVFDSGEHTKSFENYQKGIDFLADNYFRRTDALVAFGGGVIGDLGGFMSATYQRGMIFIQIPTTLLSGVDSSVGGKTGINLNQGKNLLGAFKQPKQVICDWSLYKTMENDRFLDGVAETIKYSILCDKKLFETLKIPIRQDDKRLTEIIKKCVKYKAQIVSQDEEESGIRRILNLGHTIGHSIEKLSDYNISHGYAVAIGMSYIAKLSYRLNLISKEKARDIINCIKANNLPISTTYRLEDIFKNTIVDKKCTDDMITIILIQDIGHCILEKISLVRWKEYIQMAMEVNFD